MSKFLDGIGLTDLLNKIKNAFVAKADTTAATAVNIDSTPTANSTNLVTSGGVAAALENIPSTYAGSATAGGAADKALGIPYGEVDSDSTATNIKASVDNFPTTLVAGVCAYIRNDVVGSASGFTLNINGTGAKPVYASNADASRATTIFSASTTYLFVYNPTRVSGGCWDIYYGYNANDNTIGYNLRTNGTIPTTESKFYRYRLLFTSGDNQNVVPANTSSSTNATAARTVNQAKINPFAPIYYYSTTTAINANSAPGAAYSWLQYSGIALGYSFNRTGAELTMTAKDPVFLKCAPQTDGSAIMDADTPIVQALPSTEDGNIYIYLGIAESATAITLYYWHPIYWYKDGAIRVWTNANEIVVDSTPTQGSTNLVTSGGVYATLADKADDSDVVHVTGDETIEGDKKFFDDVIVSNKAQGTDGEATIELQASSSSIAAHKYYSAETAEDFSWINWSGTHLPFPPGPGAEPVTHTKTLQQALNERNNPTIDSTPTSGSTNPVSSGGVKTALDSCAKKNQIVAEFDLSSADPTVGTITSGSYSSVIQGMGNGDAPTLHIIIKNNGVVVTSTTANLITNDYTYSFNNNNYTSLLFGTTYYSDGSIKSERCVVFHDSTNDVDCIHMLPVSQIDPASTSDLSNVVHKTGSETIGGVKTFTNRPNFNNSIFIDNSSSTASDHGVIITYEDETTLGVSGETERLTFNGPNDTILLSGLRLPESDEDAANKAYVDSSRKAKSYQVTQELPYLAIELSPSNAGSLFITTEWDGIRSSFNVTTEDNDARIIGYIVSDDVQFYSCGPGYIQGFNSSALLIQTNAQYFNVLNTGSTNINIKLVDVDSANMQSLDNLYVSNWNNIPRNITINYLEQYRIYNIMNGSYSEIKNKVDTYGCSATLSFYSTGSSVSFVGLYNLVDANYEYDGNVALLFGRQYVESDTTSVNYNKFVNDYIIVYNDGTSDNVVRNQSVIEINCSNKADKILTYTLAPAGGFEPNAFYNLGTVSGSVTWTLAASSSAADEYMIQFSTGSTAPTITWPSGITWFGGSAPTINENKTYQISIQNNLAVCGEF